MVNRCEGAIGARDYDARGYRVARIHPSRVNSEWGRTRVPLAAHLFMPRHADDKGNAIMSEIRLHVNGLDHVVALDDPDTPLLYVLRDDLALRGPKFGCGLGQCGACAVLVDGEAIRSCITRAVDTEERVIATLEGLGSPEQPSRVQTAFIAEQAAQCGYCANGMIVTAAALLGRIPRPTEADVREALAQNLCRCGSHVRVLAAVMRAAAEG
jgi:nicotinate dehydrogenase subunit A